MSNRLTIEELDGGAVRVELHRPGQGFADSVEAFGFTSPFDAAAREDLRWYLEDYLIAPHAVYEGRGHKIRSKLRGWGEALFDGLFGPGKSGWSLRSRTN